MSKPHKWIDFDRFLSRHGEHAMLGILENVERREGIHFSELLDLEVRWNAVMNYAPPQQMAAA